MCMQDVEIGKRVRTQEVWFTINAPTITGGQILGPNPHRLGIILGPAAATYSISNNPAVNATSGIQVTGFAPAAAILAKDFGEWVKGPLYVFAAAGNFTITVIESMLAPCDELEILNG